jgi:hypothetical protein
MPPGRVWRRRAIVGVVLLVGAGGGVVLVRVPGGSYRGALPPLTEAQQAARERLARHVHELAGVIGERHLLMPQRLEAAASYLETTLRATGLPLRLQPFEAQGRSVRNVEAERPGTTRRGELVVIGAHYDSVPGCPGANDNATGVAALLEIAGRFRTRRPARTVRFVGFVNEEPPFFQTTSMGSLVYARRARAEGQRIVAMLSLETIGCYLDTPRSQRYPFPFGVLFPRTGNFVAFVANFRSRDLVRRVTTVFRRHAAFPSEGAAAPGWIPGVGWSDHWAFWQAGYPAVMVTDTALYRYAHYHAPTDTPDKIDFDRLARVVDGLEAVVVDLAGD